MARLTQSSNQPDLRILAIIGQLQRIFLVLVIAVAGIVLCAWLIPAVGLHLPARWSLMKANTAILILLSAASIILCHPRASANSILCSRLLGGVVALLSAATLIQYIFGISLGLDTLITADALDPIPGRMSVQSAVSLLMLGIVLINLRARKRMLSYLADALTLFLALLMLVYASGYFFGAMRLFGLSMQHRLSPQTLFCLTILTLIVFNRRTEYGVFSILIDDGIGGKTARLAAPFAVFLPFALATIRGLVTRSNMIPEQYGVALASALLTFLAFCFILFLSSRCKQLESANRELSLRDQLTQLYNRRGFYILAEQALRLAYRAGDTFFVLYLDMDNLKQINDSLGHNVGSCLLQEMAVILQATFRETDIIGRLGGDEFAVAGTADHENFMLAITRLKAAAYTANCIPSRTYPLSFSLGYVPSSSSTETLEALLHQADSFMYAAKRGKKQLRTSPA